jgi:glycerophosphoryl diester phosphodiesterase
VLHSRLVSQLARPAVALGVFAGVQTAIQFTPFFNAALNNGWPHVLEHALYLVTGFLFWWSVLGVDATPRRAALRSRLTAVLLAVPVEAAIGLTVLLAGAPLYAHYATLPPPWGGQGALASQHRAGLLLWLGGDAVVATAAFLLLTAYSRPRVEGSVATIGMAAVGIAHDREGVPGRAPVGGGSRPVESVLHRVNTLSRLRTAIDAGVDRVEIDVRYVKGRFLLSHDVPVGPWTLGRSGVEFARSPLPLHRHGPFVGLDDLLEMDVLPLFIDLKGPWPDQALAGLSGLLRRFGRPHDLVASSRRPPLDRLRGIAPEHTTVYGVPKHRLSSALERLDREQLFGVSIDEGDLSEEAIERLHGSGLFVYAWNFRSLDRLQELSQVGIDGAIFDDPTWGSAVRRP